MSEADDDSGPEEAAEDHPGDVGGSEAAVSVFRVDERGNEVDHRAQHVALVRERIREVAMLSAGALVRVGGFGGDLLGKAAHIRVTAPPS